MDYTLTSNKCDSDSPHTRLPGASSLSAMSDSLARACGSRNHCRRKSANPSKHAATRLQTVKSTTPPLEGALVHAPVRGLARESCVLELEPSQRHARVRAGSVPRVRAHPDPR